MGTPETNGQQSQTLQEPVPQEPARCIVLGCARTDAQRYDTDPEADGSRVVHLCTAHHARWESSAEHASTDNGQPLLRAFVLWLRQTEKEEQVQREQDARNAAAALLKSKPSGGGQ